MKSRFDAAMRVIAALVTALFGSITAVSMPSARADEDVVRIVGVGQAGVFHALDVLAAAPFRLLPLGTAAFRAGLASVLVSAIAAVLLYDLARALTGAIRGAFTRLRLGSTPSPRLSASVALAATLTVTLSPAWWRAGSAVLGVLLVLVAVSGGEVRKRALALGLAAGYDPWVLLVVAAALLPDLRDVRGRMRESVVAFAVGLAPIAVSFFPRLLPRARDLGWPSAPASAISLSGVASEVGVVVLAAAAIGGVVVVVDRARWLPVALALGGALLGARLGSRASSLGAFALLHAIAAVGLAAIACAIAQAKIPFAQASAALVVVLELALPVRAADEAITERDAGAARAAAIWNDVVWEKAPPASIVLVSSTAFLRRIVVARALGELRADLVVVPLIGAATRQGERALRAEPKLVPLFRDIALGVLPEELSLSDLAQVRPVLATFDPRWDRALARHVVPLGLLSSFEAEPRGVSDRRIALDAFSPAKDRLVRVAVARPDERLARATASLLRGRALGFAAAGERELLSRALDDLRPFAPDDPVAATLVRRLVTTKGAIDVKDLADTGDR